MKASSKILTILLWLITLHANSQIEYDLKFYTQNQGLAHRSITDISRSSSGRLWIGTRQGITFYDGTEFQYSRFFDSKGPVDEFMVLFINDQYGNLIGLSDASDDKKPFLIEDSNGKIHFNTSYIDTVKVLKKKVPFSLRHSHLIHTDLGHLLASILRSDQSVKDANDEPLSFYRLINNLPESTIKLSPYEFISASVYPDNKVWIWTSSKGYIKIDLDDRSYEWIINIPVNAYNNSKTITLPLDKEGRFWYPTFPDEETKDDLSYFQIPTKFFDSHFENFIVDNLLNIWLFNANGDIVKYDRSTRQVHLIESSLDYLSASYIDSENINWIGSKLGLFKLLFKNSVFENYGSRPIRPFDTAPIGQSTRRIIETDSGDIFVHLDNGSLYFVDTLSKSFVPFDLYYQNKKVKLSINDIYYASDTLVLIATLSGLYRANLITHELEKLHLTTNEKRVINIIPGNSKFTYNLLLRNASLIEYSLKSESIVNSHQLSDSVNSIRAYDDQFIYTTAKGKLIIYSKNDFNQVFCFKLNQAYDIGEADVRDVFLTDSMIWIASYEGIYGLDNVDYSEKWHYSIKGGLSSNLVYTLAGYDYRLFAGTSNGLSIIDTRTQIVRTYLEKDGLSHNEFNSYSRLFDSKGNLWMGGLNGLNRFSPDKVVKTNSIYPYIHVNHISIYNPKRDKKYAINFLKDSIQLPLKLSALENSFDLKVALPSLYAPEENTCYWYIESIEPEWTNFSNVPIIQYKNLKPGSHSLKIMALGSRDTFSEVTTFDFIIQNHWYLSLWAIVLWISLFFTMFYFTFKIIVNRKILEEKAKQEKKTIEKRIRLYNDIAHEIRSPLTIIMGLADRIYKNIKYHNPEYLDDINRISDQSQTLVDLCDEMLEVSRLKHTAGIYDRLDTIRLLEFFNHFIPSFQTLVEEKGMTLLYKSEIDPELSVIAPSRKLQMILSNLITNAVKYSESDGNIIVSVVSTPPKKEKINLLITVQDNGPGIDPKDRNKVFKRFTKLSDQDLPGSHGLGLSIVKELVDSMDGNIKIANSTDKGAIFSVKCNFKVANTTTEPEKSTNNTAIKNVHHLSPLHFTDDKNTSQKESKMILIVDDHIDTRHYIQSCLQNLYETKTAADGLEAFSLAKTLVPDLIISDIVMPKMDGFELCHLLKTNTITSHIPIVLLTVKKDQVSSLKGLKYGADVYLPKPFKEDILKLTVKNLFKLIETNQMYNRRLMAETQLDVKKTEINISDQFVEQFINCLKENYQDPDFSVEALSKLMYMSRSQIFKKTKSLMGQSPSALIKEFRLNIAKRHLIKTNKSISEISVLAGFSSPNYFSTSFHSKYGLSPHDFRKNAT